MMDQKIDKNAIYSSPEKSHAFQKLLSQFSKAMSQNPNEFISLYSLIKQLNAPGNLLHFKHIISRILDFLGYLPKEYFSQNLDQNFSTFASNFIIQLQKLHTLIVSEDLKILDGFDSIVTDGVKKEKHKKSDNPLMGRGIGRFALWGLLYEEPYEEDFKPIWKSLAARFILCHCYVLRNWPLHEYLSYTGTSKPHSNMPSVTSYAQKLRDIAEKTELQLLVQDLTDDEISGIKKLTSVSECFTREIWLQRRASNFIFHEQPVHSDGTVENLNKISSVLNFISKYEYGRYSKHGSKKEVVQNKSYTKNSMVWGAGYVPIDEDHYCEDFIGDPESIIDKGIKHRTYNRRISFEKDEAENNNDLPTDEITEPENLILDYSIIEGALSAKNRQKHMAMNAQNFHWQTNILTDQQVKLVDDHCFQVINDIEVAHIKDTEKLWQLECHLLLLVILWSGSPLERALLLKKHKSAKTTDHETLFGYFVHPKSKKSEFSFLALEPAYKTMQESDKDKSYIKQRNSRFWLPDMRDLIPIIERFRKIKFDDLRSSIVFDGEEKDYQSAIKKIISDICNNCFYGEGVTLRKIEAFLFRQILSFTSDVTTSSLITSQIHSLSRVKLHYTTLSLEYLRKQFQNSLKSISRLFPAMKLNMNKLRLNHYVGAKNCRILSSYREKIDKVKTVIFENKDYNCPESFCAYHNALTYYSLMMFNFSTAARSVANPIEPSIIQYGEGGYADKDGHIPYHARYIAIPKMVQKHFLIFNKHTVKTQNWLKLLHTDLKGNSAFFLKGYKTYELRPANLKEFAGNYMNGTANGHRRFLRSTLIEREMPIEHIDSFMGHWGIGEEPWSKSSTFNVKDYKTSLEEYLSPLLVDLGFEIIINV